jgi:uncharacterized membrane protein
MYNMQSYKQPLQWYQKAVCPQKDNPGSRTILETNRIRRADADIVILAEACVMETVRFISGKEIFRKTGIFAMIMALFLAFSVSGQVFAAGSFIMSTSYPGITAKPGDSKTFDLDFSNGGSGVNATLSVTGLPKGWTGYFEGNGSEISNVYVKTGDSSQLASYVVEIPDDAANGAYNFTLNAKGSGASSTIQLTVNINEESAGASDIATDYAQQEGAAGSSFSFSTTIQNNSSEQQTFVLNGKMPDGWTISFTPSSESKAVTSIDVDAHGSVSLTATVTPPDDVSAGSYKIPVTAASGSETLSTEYDITITGNFAMSVTTPDQVLSFSATANSKKAVTLDIVNSGNIDLTNVSVSAEAPSGWTIEFSESTIDKLAAGDTHEVTMYVTPSKDAISGDYAYNVDAKCDNTSATTAFRCTVKAQTGWGVFAVILIIAIVAAVAGMFKKYGRH